MHTLTNVPHKGSKTEVRGEVDGETVRVVAVEKDWRGDMNSTRMADAYVGDHMLSKPQALREMIASEFAFLVRAARDAGYAQAMADVRQLIGVKQ